MTVREWWRFGRKLPRFFREVFNREKRPSLQMDLNKDKTTGKAVIILTIRPQGQDVKPIVAEFDTPADALMCWDAYRPDLKRSLGLNDAQIIEKINGRVLEKKQRQRILTPGMRVIG